jgi:hypothetical protein
LISADPLRKNHPQIQNFTENFSAEPVRQALKKRKIISTYDPGKRISSGGTKQSLEKNTESSCQGMGNGIFSARYTLKALCILTQKNFFRR